MMMENTDKWLSKISNSLMLKLQLGYNEKKSTVIFSFHIEGILFHGGMTFASKGENAESHPMSN